MQKKIKAEFNIDFFDAKGLEQKLAAISDEIEYRRGTNIKIEVTDAPESN